eukprot:CAMPEP_0175061722 /NCGR_PEP_ID=MMETSP0052_2-20121109/13746_1 /TAXON_ID=51329 ORGANISM="Polytomella parva, Strain SAG 63-3" /NCGR_SAMPLE_ID=MMETSP0052_2 /ASSEMBLY_ACC=CAM_ASM_000194 /LENGTH=263 /DNA_ID=CAMNT_0016327615 /DNA_START=63 /DNA_END=851 /DNA_ORIENTATION=-
MFDAILAQGWRLKEEAFIKLSDSLLREECSIAEELFNTDLKQIGDPFLNRELNLSAFQQQSQASSNGKAVPKFQKSIEGPVVLQVVLVQNISKPLKSSSKYTDASPSDIFLVQLTDGKATVKGMFLNQLTPGLRSLANISASASRTFDGSARARPSGSDRFHGSSSSSPSLNALDLAGIPSKPLDLNVSPGTKVLLTGRVCFRDGVLLLCPENSRVLGGRVPLLAEEWETQRMYGGVDRGRKASSQVTGSGPGSTGPPDDGAL